jgi:hypothetical protein
MGRTLRMDAGMSPYLTSAEWGCLVAAVLPGESTETSLAPDAWNEDPLPRMHTTADAQITHPFH